MVSQCANPDCTTPLLHLREGKLFQFEVRAISVPCVDMSDENRSELPTRHVSHFWLCGPCSASYSLRLEPEDVRLVDRSSDDGERGLGDDSRVAIEAWLRSRSRQRVPENMGDEAVSC